MQEYERKNGVFVVYHRNVKYLYGKTHKISFFTQNLYLLKNPI